MITGFITFFTIFAVVGAILYGRKLIKTEKTGKYGRWIVHIQGVTDELAAIWPYGD